MRRALILDGHSGAALSCTQSLGAAGLEVHLASESMDALACRSRFARHRLRQPAPADAEAFVAWLAARDAEVRYDLVVPTTESSLLAMRRLAEGDPLRVRAVLPSNLALETTLDKHDTREMASRLAVPVPRCVVIRSKEEIPEARSFPTVLKPRRSKVLINGSLVTLATVVARQEGIRRDTLEGWLPWTTVEEQEFIPGHGVGLGFLYDRGRQVWRFAWRRLHELPLTGGRSTYRRSIAPPAPMLDAATRLLDELAWHGAAMVEFRAAAEDRFHLMEINPRLWGSLALALSAGVDFPQGLLALAEGRPLPPLPSYRHGFFARSLPEDVEWLVQNLRADRSDPLLLTVSPALTLREPLRILIGRETWDHFTLRDPRVGLAILGDVIRKVVRATAGGLRKRWLLFSLARRHGRRSDSVSRTDPTRVRLLFLCQGNICRSPTAAAWARRLFPDFHVASAGFHPKEGRRVPAHVTAAATDVGLDLGSHESRSVTANQVSEADLILLMDVDNYETLIGRFPDAAGKSTLLGLYGYPPSRASIPDPLYATPEQTRRVLEQIGSSLSGLGRSLGLPGPGA